MRLTGISGRQWCRHVSRKEGERGRVFSMINKLIVRELMTVWMMLAKIDPTIEDWGSAMIRRTERRKTN